MAFETINLGTQPAGTGGDTARSAFEKTNRNFLAVEVLSAAMSQAQFEAIRAQNKERYAASGWVSFGNHEYGKQVNECKPGLYTSLTTPNTLLIGKAGGVGGSKTDNASVHIDGVVFNLTNQFVLTLPSHPTSTQPERMDMYGLESEKVEISAASPNAYQGGLRGVGAAVNLFTATDQQKKDFFSANANTTYIGTDSKIYQWQLYKVSFAGTTDGVPSPSEQGYSLNSFGDLWLKAGKNLLYFGNVLRLNDGGYHPSFNPLGAAKFVGDTFWYNTAASITSRADCFDPSKLLVGSGQISSGKSGRPDNRYYNVIYSDGQGGVCRDMRYPAYGVDSVDFLNEIKNINNGKCRGFEWLKITKISSTTIISDPFDATINGIPCRLYRTNLKFSDYNMIVVDTKGFSAIDTCAITYQGVTYLGSLYSGNGVNIDFAWIKSKGANPPVTNGAAITALFTAYSNNASIGGAYLQTDVTASVENILATQSLANGWQGSWIQNIASNYISLTRKKIDAVTSGNRIYTSDNGGAWGASVGTGGDNIANTMYYGGVDVGTNRVFICQYRAFAKQTEITANGVLYDESPRYLFSSSEHQAENGALLGESLIGKVLKNNAGVSVNNKSLLSCAIDGAGKLTSATNFDGVTHPALTLGAPSNNSPAFKAVSYLANISQQAFIQYAYTELKHNGTNWGDDGKVTIVDNQATKTDLNGNTVLVGTAKLKEPIGWIKNKV